MLEIIKLVLGLITTILIGYLFLKLLLSKEKRPFLEEIALSYTLGMGVIALEFILFWSINVKPTLINILFPWLVIFLFSLFIKKEEFLKKNFNLRDFKKNLKDFSLFEIFLLSGIALEVGLSFLRALIKPIESFDSIAIYAIRAKVFYEAGGIPKEFFHKITPSFPNSSHPLMVPLIENWVYTFLGTFNDFLVKIIFPLYFVALLVIFYFALKEFYNRKKALLFTFLLATIPQFSRFSTIGYADFVLAFYFTAGFLYLFCWLKNKNTRYLILSALLMAFSFWTKMEGWALFLCTAFVFLIYSLVSYKERRDFVKLLSFSLAVFLIGLPWILLINTMDLESDVFQFKSFGFERFVSSIFNFHRCPRIIYEFQKQFFGPKKWNIIWVVFLMLFIFNLKYIFSNDIKYITLSLVLIMVAYGYSYLLIPLEEGGVINWNISSTLSRLFIHFTPLCVFWVAYLCKDKGYIK